MRRARQTACLFAATLGYCLLPQLSVAQEHSETKAGSSTHAPLNAKDTLPTMEVSPGVTVKVLRADQLKGLRSQAPRTATMLEVTLAPLSGSPPHRHPGPISGYVLEGTFEFQVEGKEKQILKAGDTFFEPEMILHLVGHNPDAKKRTRVLATMVHPTAARQLVIPEPPQSKTAPNGE